MSNLTYRDFAEDELKYLVTAYNSGFRYNAMVSQAQRICECYMKHIITVRLLNNSEVMMSHNLRALFTYITKDLQMPLSHLHDHVMCLNNFYTHTRYPGRDAFMATEQDIDSCINAIGAFVAGVQEYL